jgi:LysR family transcriptional activator of mexEF-oprN operon
MNHFDLRRIDLNLLVVFDALILERSVTRAAERVGLGQPAVSHALRRLRTLLGDPLFVSTRQGVVPSVRALELAPWVRALLEGVQEKVFRKPAFHPASWIAEIRLGMTPLTDMALTPRLTKRLAKEAPGATVAIHATPVWRDLLERLDDRALDLFVGYAGELKPWHRQRVLWQETMLAVFSPKMIKKPSPLSLRDYLACAHVRGVQRGGITEQKVDQALALLGEKRRVTVSTPHFLVIPELLKRAPVVATLNGRVARWLARTFGLATSSLPFAVENFHESIVWHEAAAADPAQQWLRETMASIGMEAG